MSAPISSAEIRELADALANFPSNGKPPASDAMTWLIVLNFIERKEVTKSCRTCGKPQLDYSYFKITAAGRAFLAAARNGSDLSHD